KTAPFEFAKAQSALLVMKGDSEFAAGDQFTMADVLLTQTLGWAQKFKFEVDAALLEYRGIMTQRAGYARALKKIGQ
ncbi:MAG: glutathione S-transferase family protein, partial [Algicola sp.]|nr:glutathione S-transferase family protein [Algicola sp.]